MANPQHTRSPRPKLTLLVSAVLVGALAFTAVACGSSGSDKGAVRTDDAAQQSTDATGSMEPGVGPVPGQGVDEGGEVKGAVHWVRPYGDPRLLEVAGYRDTTDHPQHHPYVLFGTVTNGTSGTVVDPDVRVRWLDGDERVVHEAPATMFDSAGNVVSVLGPGAFADIVVVVSEQELGISLAEMVPVVAIG